MSTRKQYRPTDEQFARLRDASKPVPYMIIGNSIPRSPQENANAAWRELGQAMGFAWNTVEPPDNGDMQSFTAIPLTEATQ